MSEDPVWGVLLIVAFSLIGFALIAGPPWMSAKLSERQRRAVTTYVLLPAWISLGGWQAFSAFRDGDQTRGVFLSAVALLYCAYLFKSRPSGSQKSEAPGSGASE